MNSTLWISTTTIVAKMSANSTTPAPEDMATEIADFDTDIVSQVVRLVSWFLQFLTYVILVYVLVEKSPKEMGTYRW
jgi:uncharacterized membrane protein